MKYCPRCASLLAVRAPSALPAGDEGRVGEAEGRERLACPTEGCGFVHYDNPLPVVAAIVERDGKVVLARNVGWPEGMFGLVTGFLERGETPEQGIVREVKEELGLDASILGLVGVYAFEMRNELIVAYHVHAAGPITLGAEIEAVKEVPIAKLRPWPFGTGLAVRDWLEARAKNSAKPDWA